MKGIGLVLSGKRLSTKIVLMVDSILLLSCILFCSVSIYMSRVGIRESIQQRMLDIANCASGSVSGEVMKTLSKETVGSPEYNRIYDTLAVFRDNVELEYVYCIKEAEPGHFIFTMDLDQVEPASYGDDVEFTDALAKAGRGTAAVDEVPYTDKWGSFYSAYSPVKDAKGNVVGIVVVDFSVAWFEAQLSEQTKSMVGGYVIILIISQLVGAALALFTVRPYVKAQGELLAEKVRAESESNAKSDFLANMSHEIRTPINAVLGMNEMIIREDNRAMDIVESDPLVVQEALENISVYAGDVKKAGHNLLAIVNDILDFSKIEAGKIDIIEAPYQLSSLINDINNMILFKAQDKGLEFAVEVDPQIPDELAGDEVRIRQIFTNLLNNAVKYTDKGSVILKVRSKKSEEEGKILLTIIVWDTGIGIKEEDKSKLFDRFERLEMEHNSTVEGTGLGLPITHRLVGLMGGTIDVESEYGKGSIFTVTVPQKVVNDTPIGDFQARLKDNLPGENPYKESFRAPDASILFVDDTRINLKVVVNLLKNTKMKIDTATSGAESVAMAAKNKYDIIFMDQRMPEMDGTEAFHKIRETACGMSKDVPVICLTADAVIGAKERYLSEGFSDYLTKPIDNYALEKMLLKYLPENKVELVFDAVDDEDGDGNAENDFASLTSVGIEPRAGLRYCQDDADLYRSLLAEYAYGELEKANNLQKSYESENWHDYSIYVHALKSSSKMIGATALSAHAAKLEAAANAGDGVTIKTDHDSIMEEYAVVTAFIRSVVPKESAGSDDDEVTEFSPDDDVMEFAPNKDGEE